MIKVLVADDHAVEAATTPEVRQLVREQRWDVVVLDLNMPGGSGLELLGDLRRESPGARVLVLTVSQENQYAVRAIRAGAAGFLTKESAPERLIEAVRKIAAGGRYVSPELAEALASLVAGETEGAPHERLSDREFEIFKMLASGRTVSQVAQELALSVKTVSTHRTRILKKMEMKTNAELMHYAVRGHIVE